MALGTRQKLQAGAALLGAAALTAGAFFIGPVPGVFTGGAMAICGFIFHDRLTRQNFESRLSSEIKKLRSEQAKMAADIKASREHIGLLREHITETALNLRSSPAIEEAKTASLPRRRTSAVPPVPEMLESSYDPMPRAVRPGRYAPAAARRYDDLVSDNQTISDTAVQAVVKNAIKTEHVEVFLQPIVRLPQRKVRFYEMFARVRAKPGLYLAAARYMKIAQDLMGMRDIDRLLLAECLDIVRETAQLDRAAPFFVNVSAASLKNGNYMKKLLSFLGRFPELAPRLVFEMTQSDFKSLKPPVAEIIRSLGKLGCAFSIDNVTDMNFDIERLLSLRVRYVKIAASDLLRRTGNDKEFADTRKLKRKLEGNGISLIVEKIESERALRELLDFDINYGQGYLFGKPDMQAAFQDKRAEGRRR